MNTSKKTTFAQAEKLKSLVAEALVAGGKFDSVAQVHEHIAYYIPGHFEKRAWWHADVYLSHFVLNFSENVSIPASQESREWSCGFEGGHVLWDSRSAKTAARSLAQSAGVVLQ